MNPDIVYSGMDVCKAMLDLSVPLKTGTQRKQFPNTAPGRVQLVRWLKGLGPIHIVCEASGGYERAAVEQFHRAAIPVSVVNPLHVRFYAKSKGLRAKTDRLDADLLADYGRAHQPSATLPRSESQQELSALVERREQLKEIVKAESNRLAQVHSAAIRRLIQAHLRFLEKQLAQVEALLEQVATQDPILNQKSQKLCGVKAIGQISAHGLLATVPELGQVNRRRIAALVGVAPYNDDSGPFSGTRTIQGGRPQARRILYMAALVAARHNPTLKTFYSRLIATGKPPKLALTAVMRRLLIHLNTLLKTPLTATV